MSKSWRRIWGVSGIILLILSLFTLWVRRERQQDSAIPISSLTATSIISRPSESNLKIPDPNHARQDLDAKASPQATVRQTQAPMSIRDERVPRIQSEMDGIVGAIVSYYEEIGEYPTGNNAEVAKALFGSNKSRKIFLGWNRRSYSNAGELLDPWGTGYQIAVTAGGKVDIRSAGGDLLFWTKDDVVYKSSR